MNLDNFGETLVFDGGALKALDDKRGVGGYLILWGDETKTDASERRDYFTPETDLGRFVKAGSLDMLFHHGLPMVGPGVKNDLADDTIGEFKATTDKVGLFMEGVLKVRSDYEAQLHDAIKRGKMGLSSGTPAHMVRRVAQANGSNFLKRWPVVEGSITPSPAEPRTAAFALKSLCFESEGGPPVPGDKPTLAQLIERTVSDARECKSLIVAAIASRKAEGRGLSGPKLDAIKSLAEELAALNLAATKAGGPSADELRQLEADFLAFDARWFDLSRAG